MEKYIDYILTSIIIDVEEFAEPWTWFVVTTVIYLAYIIFKYALLTLPFWLPFHLVLNILKDKNEVK